MRVASIAMKHSQFQLTALFGPRWICFPIKALRDRGGAPARATNRDGMTGLRLFRLVVDSNEDGQLVAKEVLFDRDSMRVSLEIGTRVSPLEARATALDDQPAALDSRAGQMGTKQGQLEQTEVQTQQQVGEVKTEAGKANEGLANVNQRVNSLDNYQEVETATVYFAPNSSSLSDESKEDLDKLAQDVLTQKAYRIEVAGFADTAGKTSYNQILSGERANAVMHYLEEHGNVPIYRIIAPAGMGTSHEAAPNSTSEGRKLNRRVEVKVLVNQGEVAGGTETSSATVPQQ